MLASIKFMGVECIPLASTCGKHVEMWISDWAVTHEKPWAIYPVGKFDSEDMAVVNANMLARLPRKRRSTRREPAHV